MQFKLNFAFINEDDGLRAEIVDSESPEEIQKNYVCSPDGRIVYVCQINIRDENCMGIGYHPATAYEVTQSIDRMSDIPHMHNLMMLLCAKAFEAGMKYRTEQEDSPITIVP